MLKSVLELPNTNPNLAFQGYDKKYSVSNMTRTPGLLGKAYREFLFFNKRTIGTLFEREKHA